MAFPTLYGKSQFQPTLNWTHIYLKTTDGIYISRFERSKSDSSHNAYGFNIPDRYQNEYLVWSVGREKNPFEVEILYTGALGKIEGHYVVVPHPTFDFI